MARSSKMKQKVNEDIPDIDTLTEIDVNKPSKADPRAKKKPGLYWKDQRYDNETALVKAVTAELRTLIRSRLKHPVDVFTRDGYHAREISLARLELELEE